MLFALIIEGSFLLPIKDSIENLWNGGTVEYDEAVMQEYGQEKYYEIFDGSNEYESNILIVFLVNDERDGYYAYACVGNDLSKKVRDMFGDERTTFGRTMLELVNDEYYGYSLGGNLADVTDEMRLHVRNADKSFYGNAANFSVVKNYSNMRMSETLVTQSLQGFTDDTGIGIAYVIENEEDVFGRKLAVGDIIVVVVIVLVIAAIVFLLIRKFKKDSKDQFGKAVYEGSNHEDSDRADTDEDGENEPDVSEPDVSEPDVSEPDENDGNRGDEHDRNGETDVDDGIYGDKKEEKASVFDRLKEKKKEKQRERDRYNRNYKKGNYNKKL